MVEKDTLNNAFPYGGNEIYYPTIYTRPVFDNIALPSRSGQQLIRGYSEYCQLGKYGNYEFTTLTCALWTKPIGPGYVSLVSWDFSGRYKYNDIPYYWSAEGSREDDSWPNDQWRTALLATLNPGGPAEAIIPIFDYTYLPIMEQNFTVLMLLDGSATNIRYASNILPFLEMSNINVKVFDQIAAASVFEYHLQSADALLVPSFYLFDYLFNEFSIGYYLGYSIREFAENGGNVVTLGTASSLFMNNVFFTDISETMLYREYVRSDPYPVLPRGYDFESHPSMNSLFSVPRYPTERTLPGFLGTTTTLPNSVLSISDFCPYTLQHASQYCAVYSRMYGSGHISLLAHSFGDLGYGTASTYVNALPWARVLNIALGADPNDPSASATITPSASGTSTGTPSASSTRSSSSSMSLSPSKTPTISNVVSMTPSISDSASASSSRSRTVTQSESRSGSSSVSRSPAPSRTKTPSSSGTPSNSPSPTASRSSGASFSPTSSNSPSISESRSSLPSKTSTNTQSASPTPSTTRSKSLGNTFVIAPPVPPLPSVLRSIVNSVTRSTSASGTPINSAIAPSQLPSRAPIIFPTAAAQGCSNCGGGQTEVLIDDNSNTGGNDQPGRANNGDTVPVPLVSTSGELVGSLGVPQQVAASGPVVLEAVFINHVGSTTQNIGSSVVDITIIDSFGNLITEFDDPIEICLEEDGPVDDHACLSFFNKRTGEWECEDECLERVGSTYCGETNHLTSFALLLSGGNGGGDPCNSSEDDFILAWISFALVCTAICCVFFAILFIEAKYRKKRNETRVNFRKMSQKVSSQMGSME